MKLKCGIDEKEYSIIHSWLRRQYGAANKCESDSCEGWCVKYHYALRKGFQYKKDRNNFIMLCLSCHLKYDWDESKRQGMRTYTDERRAKVSASRKGRCNLPKEFIEHLSEKMKGSGNHMYGISINGKDHHFYGKHHTEDAKKKIFNHQAKASKEQVEEIRKRAANGEKQIVLVKEFGLSRASVCRIVNNKRYRFYE